MERKKYDRMDRSAKAKKAVASILLEMERVDFDITTEPDEVWSTEGKEGLENNATVEASMSEWARTQEPEKRYFFQICCYIWKSYYGMSDEHFWISEFYYLILLFQLLYYEKYEETLTEVRMYKMGEGSLFCYGAREFMGKANNLKSEELRLKSTIFLDGLLMDIFNHTKSLRQIKEHLKKRVLKYYGTGEAIVPERELDVH